MQLPETWLAIFSLVILCGTILGGAATAFMRLADKNTPFDIGLLHGRAGIFGITLLVLSVVVSNETGSSIKPAIGLFVFTALAGISLYFIIRRKGILPKSIIFLHGAFAISAVYTLLHGIPF